MCVYVQECLRRWQEQWCPDMVFTLLDGSKAGHKEALEEILFRESLYVEGCVSGLSITVVKYLGQST